MSNKLTKLKEEELNPVEEILLEISVEHEQKIDKLAEDAGKVSDEIGTKISENNKEIQNGFDTIEDKIKKIKLKPGPKGEKGDKGDKPIAGKDYKIPKDGKDGKDGKNGQDGKSIKGDQGPKGDSIKGDTGEIGPMPKHEWQGTKLRFERAPNVWGDYVDLRGPKGSQGYGGGGGGLELKDILSTTNNMYAKLDGSNQPFTGEVDIALVDTAAGDVILSQMGATSDGTQGYTLAGFQFILKDLNVLLPGLGKYPMITGGTDAPLGIDIIFPTSSAFVSFTGANPGFLFIGGATYEQITMIATYDWDGLGNNRVEFSDDLYAQGDITADNNINGVDGVFSGDITGVTVTVGGKMELSAQWIDLDVSATWAGIGTGGAGGDAWVAYAFNASDWLTGTVKGDIVSRNQNGSLCYGNSVIALKITDDQVEFPTTLVDGSGINGLNTLLNFTRDSFDSVLRWNGSSFVDYTNEAKSTRGTGFTPIPTSAYELYIGKSAQFGTVYCDVGTAAVGQTSTFYYSTGQDTWAVLTVVDNTANMTTDGTITFTPPLDWALATYQLKQEYWIKIGSSTSSSTDATLYLCVPQSNQALNIWSNAGDTYPALGIDENGLLYIGVPIINTVSMLAGLTVANGITGSSTIISSQSLTNASTDGLVNLESTVATGTATERWSPRLRWTSRAWTGTVSNTVNFIEECIPTSAAIPTGELRWSFDLNGGGYATRMSLFSNGNLILTGNLTMPDAKDIILNTITGTKIGTATGQKLGFWNTAPIVQPTTAVAAAALVGGGGATITDTDTFDGYTLKQIVKALRNEGLLA